MQSTPSIMPWQLMPGTKGPTENAFGLDVLVRKVTGDETTWDTMKAQLILGAWDSEWPNMHLVTIEPDRPGGSMMEATLTFKGYNGGGDGSAKPAQVNSSRPVKTATAQCLRQVAYTLQDGMNPLVSHSGSFGLQGELSFSYYAQTYTFRYIRSALQSGPQFATQAAALLASATISPFDIHWTQQSNNSYSGAYTFTPEDLATTANGLTRTARLADFTQSQQGVWYEIEESWEISVVDPSLGQ